MAYAGRVRADPEIPALQAFADSAADATTVMAVTKTLPLRVFSWVDRGCWLIQASKETPT
jgi:hypothetical protein